MDIIHHTAIGGIAMATLVATGNEIAGMVFLVGSVIPDLDVFFMIFGKRAYLKNHQGPTHSLLMAPVIACLFTLPLFSIVQNPLLVFLMALCGMLLHIFLDWSNTFGIGLIWPWRNTRFCMDAVFFIDLFLWCLTLSFAGLIYIYSVPLISVVYLVLFFSYVAFKIFLHGRVCLELNCDYSIPSSINPFTFYILEQTSNGVNTYLYNAFSKRKWNVQLYSTPPRKYTELASGSQVYRDMQSITKYLFITDVVKDETGIIITANDLAIRNYGGKFGQTVLRFDSTGQLLDEKANI
ncbi:MAG: metal-dependent hydrolase [Pseudomonadota bacterium]